MRRTDFEGRSDDEVAEQIEQMHALSSAALAHMLEAVREFEARKAYEVDGARSMACWLEARLGVLSSSANQLARTARSLSELPELEELLASGRVSYDQLRPVAQVIRPDQDHEVAGALPALSAAQAEELARAARRRRVDDENEEHGRRSLRLGRRGEMCTINGRVSEAEGEIVRKALARLAEGYPKDPETGLHTPFDQRMADAFVDICSAGIADDEDADLATVVVHLGPEVFGGGDGHVVTESGTHLSAEAARRLLCDCRLQAVREDEAGSPLSFSTVTHSIPPSLYRQLRRRDRVCRFPGCHSARLVNGHHIVFWGKGGPTEMANLCLLCRRHHRLVHEGGWRIDGDPGGELTFTSPSAKVLSSRPMPLLDEIERRFFAWRHGPPGGCGT